MESINKIVALCKGTTKHKETARDFRSVVNSFMDCATDARSALCKTACLGIAAIAAALGPSLDSCSDFIVPPLLSRTNHGTAVISESSRFAVINYCAKVYGKHTKSVLKIGYQSRSAEARSTVIQAMIAACNSWPREQSDGLPEIIMQATKDKNNKVREVATLFNQELSALTSAAQTPARQSFIPSKTPLKTPAGTTPYKTPKNAQDEGITPMKRPKRKNDEGVTPMKESAPSEINLDDEVHEDIDLLDALNQEDTNAIVEFLETRKPDLFGYMQLVIDIICDEAQKEMPNNAPKLVQILTQNYGKYLYSFLNIFVDILPDDEKCGKPIIDSLISYFGEEPISYLLYESKQPYSYSYILNYALKTKDADRMAKAVLASIQNGAYEYNHVIIYEMFQKINDQDKSKLEYLFMCIPDDVRNSIFTEIESTFPELVNLFKDGRDLALEKLLKKEMRKALDGKSLDIKIIKEALQEHNSSSLIAIRVLREAQKFSLDFIPMLMVAVESENKELAKLSGKVLKHFCKIHPECVKKVPECLSTTYYGFRAFIGLIKSAPREDVITALESVKDQMIAALQIQGVRNAVLEVLATLITKYGPDFQTFLGDLDKENRGILSELIEKRKQKA